MKLIGPLTKKDPAHWALIPTVCRRIVLFVDEFHTDQSAEQMVNFVHANFIMDSGTMFLLAWTDDEQQVVGHLLGWIDTRLDQTRALFIAQLWSDTPLSRAFWDEGISAIDQWAREHHIHAVEAWVQSPAVARLYRRMGFFQDVYMTAFRRTM